MDDLGLFESTTSRDRRASAFHRTAHSLTALSLGLAMGVSVRLLATRKTDESDDPEGGTLLKLGYSSGVLDELWNK